MRDVKTRINIYIAGETPTTWPLDIEKKLNSNSKLRIKNPKGTFKTLSNTMKQILYKLNHDL
jgi:hypothetical protein